MLRSEQSLYEHDCTPKEIYQLTMQVWRVHIICMSTVTHACLSNALLQAYMGL